MEIVFMGTPAFAVPCLEVLATQHEVKAVFTQPDKPNGRKMKLQFSPVKKKALEYGISICQPNSLRKGEDAEKALAYLKKLNPDCIVVAAYGQILPKEILELPKYGCINIHASLLPKYRGAAPIQHCLLNGETETGVTIMQMAEGLDTGDMLLKKSIVIHENEIAEELHDRLAKLGAELILPALDGIQNGSLTPEKQDDAQSCYASMIRKEMSALDFEKSAQELHRIICGLTGFTKLDGKRLKVIRAVICENSEENQNAEPGMILNPERFIVQCGDNTALQFIEVQLEGGKRMPVKEFLRGKKLIKGQKLGE
ncbi:MAG: methionyl-tRNA formyltransferase [Oscillospiraceae bacterium]|nr:methionyl-tRNA formyltransferase [Oscillospiraceae bacterium]